MNPEIKERQAEDRIETVLAALRHAEPAPGMEQRLTNALQRAEHSGRDSSRQSWIGIPQLAVTAAVFAAAILFSTHVYRRYARLAHPAMLITHAAQPGGPDTSRKTTVLSPAPDSDTAHILRAAHTMGSLSGRRPSPMLLENGKQDTSEQAKAEQGFPAPPLPLTEQERLLVRLVHRDDPVQLAQLTPAAREADRQREREQIHEFFKAPPMLAANFTLEPYPTLGGTQ